ncbi:biotin--[acetyl-CoA-carboxylase] ligase [Microbacterium dextranolyticum]|uniref:Biotin--[acetyl-CoA-carboxylase] ligase n=1 Tax=Microbacterium dextranolyticum TaxID=36806 RepID=A0A9W6M5J6_9MICO|nr:biotin--[acetyl-CoA-carboxylase] ligase [Microbacterium dextranolyticum]MBM7463766.1 BirA family biotin operon repressor/biotin-[acetyl-CoA-carboxylase] ligase [Microbacterium dextranolyticum]GLJ94847.1 biotin--[acetyl-CoA-carboxylase] ligase [Microbacterium dextranolyticum]
MPIPAEGYPLAAAVTPRLQVVETVDSTNAKLLHDAATDAAGHPHLSVLLTRDQRAGRGRLDRVWTAPPGTALAVSVLLRVGAIAVADRGWIPLVAGSALRQAIAAQLPDARVSLKWPNDVLVGSGEKARKISGILTEVLPADPMVVVVGAGVNTTMPTVDLPVPTATSFADQDATVDEDRLVADYLTGLRDGIADLAVGGHTAVADRVAAHCSTIGTDVSVSLPGDGATLQGRAVRLDAEGRLVVAADGVETVVGAGDVVHVR